MQPDLQIPEFSLGCFGSALLYRKQDMVCRQCPFSDRCEPMHLNALEKLRLKFGIVPEKKTRRVEKSTTPETGIVRSKPLQALIDKLDDGGFDIVAKMKNGENPFIGKIAFMAIAAHLIMRLGRPVDRDTLTTAMATKMKWPHETAKLHAAMAMVALKHVGAIDLIDGCAMMRN